MWPSEHQDGAPLEHNWMNRKGSEDFSRLVDYQDEFQKGARRFDMGEKSNPPQLMAACAALTQLLDWGTHNISATLGARNSDVANSARQMGLQVTADELRSPHFLGLGQLWHAKWYSKGFCRKPSGQKYLCLYSRRFCARHPASL